MQRILGVSCALLCALTLRAQTRIDLRTQGRNVDFGDAASTRPVKTGPVLPATCQTGEMFFLTTATAGQNVYGCVAGNTWAVQSDANAAAAAAAVASVAGKTGTVALETPDMTDCKITRTSPSVLTMGACNFGYPNRVRRSLSGITITAVSGTGLAYIYAKASGAVEVSHTGTLKLTCSGCTDAGVTTGFPADVIRLGIWNSSLAPGEWNATGATDERTFMSGPVQIQPASGIVVTTTALGDKQIGIDTATVPTKPAAQAGQYLVCAGTGTSATQTCSMTPLLTAYTAGMRIRFRPGATNTGAQTLNIDNLGARPVRKAGGINDPLAGELAAGNYYDLTYDGAAFQMASSVSAGAGVVLNATPSGNQIAIDPVVVQTRAGSQAGQELLCSGTGSAAVQICWMTPALTVYTAGMRVRFRPGTTNASAQTLNVDGLGAKNILRADGVTPLSAGDLVAGYYYDLTYDGVAFRMPPGSAAASAGIDPSMQSKAGEQSGQQLLCSGTGSFSAQVCSMMPALTAYTAGMRIRFRPGTSNAGTQTLNIDGLGARSILRFDGATTPVAGELVAGNYYDLTYDGAAFRMMQTVTAGSGILMNQAAAGTQVSIDSSIVATRAALQAGQALLCSGSGPADSQICLMTPALTVYTAGMRIRFRPGTTNASGAATLNIDALGAKSIRRSDGITAVSAGDLVAGSYYDLTYDGTVFRMPPVGQAPQTDLSGYVSKAGVQAGQELVCAGSASATGPVCSMNPVLTTYTSGMKVHFRAGATNTGAVTLSIDGLGARSIKKADGITDPATGDLIAGQYYTLTYDGSAFRLPASSATLSVMRVYSYAPAAAYQGEATVSRASSGWSMVAGANGTSSLSQTIGTTSAYAEILYADNAAKYATYQTRLPANFNGGLQANIDWRLSSGGIGNVKWTARVACIGNGSSVTTPVFSAGQSAVGAGSSTSRVTTTLNADFSACAAGSTMHIEVAREGADALDTATVSAFLMGIEVSYLATIQTN